jgi:hypothetical protein
MFVDAQNHIESIEREIVRIMININQTVEDRSNVA